MKMGLMRVSFCTALLLIQVGLAPSVFGAESRVRVVDVEPVWSGHRVGFSLLTDGDAQFVAYYDAARHLTVAQRQLNSTEWTFTKLPRTTGWDSHNYITMAVDRQHHLHVSGDMHCVPLVYFRTTRPDDASSLERVVNMVGPERERRVTYPKFMFRTNGELVFRYRDGSSGNGSDLYNVYDEKSRQWRRLIDTPLTSGQGEMNAYCSMPALGPDGAYHMVWVWRDTGDAATNHDVSYARSRDLVHWENAAGKPLALPIVIESDTIVDPVPPHGGVINGNVRLGFDSDSRPIVSYHKYDDQGHTQIYCARPHNGVWQIHQVSDWKDYRWNFGGGGSLVFDVRVGAVKPIANGRLTLSYGYPRGSGTWVLDESSLQRVNEKPPRNVSAGGPTIPASLRRVESSFPGMAKQFAFDLGKQEGNRRDVLSWETLGSHRDRPRTGPLPEPSMLRVLELN